MPRDTLTPEQIVRTAVQLLDEEGLEGLNMRSLGKRLGAAATAVYWHVKNKDDLVQMVADHVWQEIELPPLDSADWRGTATATADGLYAMFLRHPWLVQAVSSHLLHGTAMSRYDDHLLGVFETAGFTPEEADRAAGAVFTYVLGNALGASATACLTRKLRRAGGDPEQAFQETLARAAETAEPFPRLRARLHTPAATEYAAAPEGTYAAGLRALLAGLRPSGT
ncbi:TetR/AcrR family transcriptional regulator C-terminal domain-containing protein [Streptomyces actinomycinicus]|uniref:TetR/AcrR family transcriptional regulator C-terminal domain-containing protein n=1 Tax=Streptomyces actinomycinicus TaxID=1695166 RepID=A0A937JSY8_9ACTN|nr:TetR/AcrR family transcriptional regulator C-terminal domain-containing protein [Streptomyces actinomycinicus]MBL1087237.1 TetR/AcrR family transcriptional regulator C-terminal domain-containing protein [Streptomyces actinomycinicus]